MKTATLVKVIKQVNGMVVRQALYKLSKPLEGHKYVVVSAANVVFSGPETYIFGANAKGEVTDWIDLEGSYRGGFSHEKALSNAGYTVKVKKTAKKTKISKKGK